jgi:signal transduction histidine kinase
VLSRAIQVAYPAMDILVVAPLAGLVFSRRARSTSFVLLLLAIVAMLLADEVYYGGGVSYRWLDAFWLASYVLWGAAALHPSVARLAERRDDRDPQLNRGRLLLFAAAVLAGPVVLAVQSVRGKSTHPNVVAGFGGAISVLVLLRVAGLVRELAALREVERSGRIEAEAANVVVSEQNLQLRELDRLKDEFVGLVSHELRTPLTSITGYVELLEADETGPLNEEQRAFLATVARNADRLLRLVNDMLFVARLHSGMLELELDPVDLTSLVEHAVAGAGPGAEARGFTLELVSTGETAVLGDEERLAQLLDNLVSNAVKFTPDGGSVTVRLWAEEGTVVLEVTDSGIGVPEGERERLFERFYRGSTAVSRQIQGTGLGLHVAQAIVAAHGGVISVSSEVDSGTTLRVELPAPPVASKVGV